MGARIYFDHAATTPLDQRVRGAMDPFLENDFGNASSLHHEGRSAREAVERARGQVADFLGAESSEIIFTGSGTEADNLEAPWSRGRGPRHHKRHRAPSGPRIVPTPRKARSGSHLSTRRGGWHRGPAEPQGGLLPSNQSRVDHVCQQRCRHAPAHRRSGRASRKNTGRSFTPMQSRPSARSRWT